MALEAIDELEGQIPGDADSEQWIVYGMLYDMTDVGETVPQVIDNVDAFNAVSVFRGLRPDAGSVRGYQAIIRLQNNNLQSFAMEQLVTSYRW